MEDLIIEFLSENDYDVRKTNNARWIDQKCAIDVVSAEFEKVVAEFDKIMAEE